MYTNRSGIYVLLIAVCAAVSLSPRSACGQTDRQPEWVNEAWQERKYPSEAWYTGFGFSAQGGKGTAESNRVAAEETALKNMAQKIRVNVSAESNLRTRSDLKQDGKSIKEATDESYARIVQTKTVAEVAGVKVQTWHNPKTGAAYALAAVKKSDLASYYVSRADYHIQRAENAVNEARQLTGLGKRNDALRKSAEGTDNLDECVQYLRLLSAVDYGGGESKRLLARETAMRQEITAATAEMEKAKEAKVFYVGGTETLGGARSDILISKLKSVIAKNGYSVDDDHRNADYNLLVEAKECDKKSDRDFTYCYACVRVNAINLKTGKTEGRIDFKGAKAGVTDGDAACRKAFENAADEVWAKIKEDIAVFK